MMGWQPPHVTHGAGANADAALPVRPVVAGRVLAKLLRADPAESFVQLLPSADTDGMVGLHVDAMVRLDAEEARLVSQLLADEG